MQPPESESMVDIMVAATSGAEGLREDWLVDYFAAESEKYRLQVVGLQGFINQTWEYENVKN